MPRIAPISAANWKIWPQRDAGAHELSSYAERPETIEHALALLVRAEAPTAGPFRDLCGCAPAPVFRAAPEPKQRQQAAEVRHRCLRPVAPRTGRDVA